MKKLVLALLLILPISVLASEPKVLTLTATSYASTVNYEGTTEDEVYAVMCKIYDSKDEEIDMISLSVDENKFSGKFENISNGSYEVRCARYEGGDVVKTSVDVTNSNNPKTSDPGIIKSVAILAVSLAGIVIGVSYFKKKAKN